MPKSERDAIYAEARIFCSENGDLCERVGTEWSIAFGYNSVILILSFFNFVLLMIGSFWFYPRFFGTCFNCCLGGCHLVAWVLGLANRFGPLG